MQIERSLSLIDTAVSAMRGQGEYMLNITSGLANARTTAADMVGTESDMSEETGILSRGSLSNLDFLPVQMTNLSKAAQAYEANAGLLSRYRQMTETKLELLG